MASPFLPIFEDFFRLTESTPLAEHHQAFRQAVDQRLAARPHGRADDWDQIIADLTPPKDSIALLNEPAVRLTAPGPVDTDKLRSTLAKLHPWRKGPFNIFDVFIDSEWRSDWKWSRLIDRIEPLRDRNVLDIGCGNGYYLYRMLGAGAKLALGIDPTRLFCYQFQALQLLQPQNDAAMLPLLDEDLPITHSFDTVFSMGVLYHRKQPEVHLDICRQALVPGGELILETLIIDHPGEAYLKPEGRYAKMRNVGELPSVPRLFKQLSASGFLNAQVVDLSPTSTLEQRATDWMHFQSLSDFLDPKAPELTIEGHPAPLRAVVSAKTP